MALPSQELKRKRQLWPPDSSQAWNIENRNGFPISSKIKRNFLGLLVQIETNY